MSVQNEIGRLSMARRDIADAITAKGIAVPSGTRLNGMAQLILQIGTASGGGGVVMSVNMPGPVGGTVLSIKTLPAGTYQVLGCGAGDGSVGRVSVFAGGEAAVAGNDFNGYCCLVSGTFTLDRAKTVTIEACQGSYGDSVQGVAVAVWRLADEQTGGGEPVWSFSGEKHCGET